MSDDDYEVGYGRPPKHSQFKKGQSGNRNGRPKKRKRGKDLFHGVLDSETESGGKKVILAEILVKQIVKKALQGNVACYKILLPFLMDEGAETEDFDPTLDDERERSRLIDLLMKNLRDPQ